MEQVGTWDKSYNCVWCELLDRVTVQGGSKMTAAVLCCRCERLHPCGGPGTRTRGCSCQVQRSYRIQGQKEVMDYLMHCTSSAGSWSGDVADSDTDTLAWMASVVIYWFIDQSGSKCSMLCWPPRTCSYLWNLLLSIDYWWCRMYRCCIHTGKWHVLTLHWSGLVLWWGLIDVACNTIFAWSCPLKWGIGDSFKLSFFSHRCTIWAPAKGTLCWRWWKPLRRHREERWALHVLLVPLHCHSPHCALSPASST